MKEIGTFKIDKNMCSNCREDEKCPQKYSANGKCLHIEKDLIKEQVPETWEELKELCEDLESKDVFITSAGDCIEYHGLQFWVSGTVCHETEKFYSIKSDRTPPQMWQIIKSLIGEE